ncbi:MAG: transporter substrate-binding domain-containing protein [Chloroflexi bacterium]|nr:transporter substrate-binding domain-containing protein [Chloroflexota bacterium]
MQKHRTWILLVVLALTVITIAACSTPTPEVVEKVVEKTVVVKETVEVEKTVVVEVTKELPKVEKITVGTNAEYPPFESVDEGGNIIGFDIDLMNAIAKAAGFEVEFVNTRWDGIFVALASGEFDAVISAATITDERKQTVDFSAPYFNAGQTLAVKIGSDIKSVDDLSGKRVGVQLGTTGDIWASENTDAEVVRYDEITLAFQALAQGDIDAVINDAPTSAAIIKANPEMGVTIVGEPFTEEFYGIAVNKNRPEVLAAINAGLATVRATGEYDEIYNKWFGVEEAATGGEAMGVGNTFIFGRGGDSVQLDPAVVTDGESFRVTNQGCESLLAYDKETTNVIPSLAESWESNADGTEWVFHLRQGVKFHDGSDFNADAVVFNFQRWWDPENPYHYETQAFEYWDYMWNGFKGDSVVTNIEKVDDYTVKFTLSEPLAPILANMAMPMFSIASPEAIMKYGADYGTPGVGFDCTGPYKFKEWVTGDHITLVRNEDYWGEIPGNVDTIVIRVIPDNSARFLALRSGEIDAMEQANIEDLKTAEAADDVYVLTRPALNTAYLAFNYKIKEFQDKRVREAIASAIDKQSIVETFYGKYGEVAENFLPPLVWGHNPDVHGIQYDPDRAKELLKEAGFENGLSEVTLEDGSTMPLTLFYMPVVRFYYPDPEGIAQAMAAQLAAVGINAKLELAGDWPTYLDKRRNGELMGLYQLGWGGDNGDPDNFLCYFFCGTEEPKASEGWYQNPELASLLSKARSITDQKEREALYQQAEQMLYEDAARIWVAHNKTPLIFSKAVSGYIPNAVGTDLYKFVTVNK